WHDRTGTRTSGRSRRQLLYYSARGEVGALDGHAAGALGALHGRRAVPAGVLAVAAGVSSQRFRLPAVDPVVERHHTTTGHYAQSQVSRQRCRLRQVIDPTISARSKLHAYGAGTAYTFITFDCKRGLRSPDLQGGGERFRVLNRKGPALCEKWQHGMSRV